MLKKGQLSIVVVCIVLGIMLAVQFRTTQDSRSSIQYQRAEDLMQRLMAVEKERDSLTQQLNDLHQTAGSSAANSELETNTKLAAGQVPLQGPGIIITIDDKKVTAPTGKNPNLYMIQDIDLLKILNELRAAGAESISINNQRIIAATEIRTAGPFISVNNTNTAAPFEIKAIGDPTTLENALKIRGGVVETIQFWGIQVAVKQSPTVEIPAFKGVYRFQYAQPVEDGGEQS